MPDFDVETAVVPTGPTTYRAELHPGWWVFVGPNGGYVAAVVLRALTLAVNDPSRVPRSMTVHYLRVPDQGPVEVIVTLEREGRSQTNCSARLSQGGRTVALALAAFSAPRQGPEFCDLRMPDVPTPEECTLHDVPQGAPPVVHRWEMRWAVGSPPGVVPGPTSEAVTGGWIRLPEGRVVDPLVAAAITDAWLPPLFSRLVRESVAVPTLDLTVHFRSALPLPAARPDDWVLCVFRSKVAAEGFVEEDGEVWSREGVLLAQSRQLAAMVPFRSR